MSVRVIEQEIVAFCFVDDRRYDLHGCYYLLSPQFPNISFGWNQRDSILRVFCPHTFREVCSEWLFSPGFQAKRKRKINFIFSFAAFHRANFRGLEEIHWHVKSSGTGCHLQFLQTTTIAICGKKIRYKRSNLVYITQLKYLSNQTLSPLCFSPFLALWVQWSNRVISLSWNVH